MRMANRIASIIIFLFGLLVFIGAQKLDYILKGIPGPGFLPRWVALLIMILALVPFIKSFTKHEVEGEQPFKFAEFKNAGIIIGSAVAVMLLTKFIGLSLAIGLMAGVIAKFTGPTSWKKVIAITVVTPVAAFVLFDIILSVPLPTGIFGF
ncbi:Tripartite tricarboxylate transporter TctB family [Desulfitobacterium dichloroeliminans LMG P-21439]|uniref:Tripartite tricarboxylate transporter TctB family n=1 Tax=Desulfitobacterium dichloroeliminans (strain LMG P-21439 / DCA1) TaxID=871963 RepID=L0F554_DESDL|nr:tripartite tricarboxylate transporter TctB family protein [Desulfitobacterium dichloroeliminans]AGA68322.1 Tripartite tricarboxylate transporter TctB family [Desulfitobacterium dichloroeliminans LMG P-21439]